MWERNSWLTLLGVDLELQLDCVSDSRGHLKKREPSTESILIRGLVERMSQAVISWTLVQNLSPEL